MSVFYDISAIVTPATISITRNRTIVASYSMLGHTIYNRGSMQRYDLAFIESSSLVSSLYSLAYNSS